MVQIYPFLCLGIFILMIISARITFLVSMHMSKKFHKVSSGTIDAAVFGLLGLLVAFTFAGAHSRFESRRVLIANEANAIGTAFLRLDLLPSEPRSTMQKKFIEYIESRINFFPMLANREEALNELNRTQKIQEEIWFMAITETANTRDTSVRMLLLPSLNEVFDIVTSRTLAVQSHTSPWVFVMLLTVALICAILSGFNMAMQGYFHWLHIILFVMAASVTIYIIFDLEYPRFGLITLDYAHSILSDTKTSMLNHAGN